MADYIVINDDLRTMTIPEDIVLLGVESDDDVNKIPFQMPKEYSGYDLSQFSARINYMNANGDGDVYVVDDLTVDGDDPSLMTFTWLVGRNACAYKGDTQFIVCLKKFADDESGDVVQEFNTTVYSLPVLEGLETTEAVVQQNADIIEYLMNLIEQAGVVDPDDYYTKAETDALIPTRLPNPESLVINGTSYDGSEPVDMTIEATSEVLQSASGAVIHVVDAVPQAVESLELFDSNNVQLASAEIAVTNKNLFRIDLLADHVVSKGVTFDKQDDGSIECSGTSTGTYAMTSCSLDKYMFAVGNTYTLSSGKTTGYTYVQLIMNYTDNTTDYIVARNSARSFTITKEVSSCTASVQLTDSGVTVDNETVYPQLEIASSASAFVINTYSTMTFDGSSMPVLPASISNLWANDDAVANIEMQYEADTVIARIDDYVTANVQGNAVNGTLIATHDGLGTVTIGLG
ncbi:hypothetical protein [Anaerotignum sp.]